jgi:hypothetical protein
VLGRLAHLPPTGSYGKTKLRRCYATGEETVRDGVGRRSGSQARNSQRGVVKRDRTISRLPQVLPGVLTGPCVGRGGDWSNSAKRPSRGAMWYLQLHLVVEGCADAEEGAEHCSLSQRRDYEQLNSLI